MKKIVLTGAAGKLGGYLRKSLSDMADTLVSTDLADDVGTLFPNDDPLWKDADSKALLVEAVALASRKGWYVENADVVISTEGPKIKPLRAEMRASIARLLGVDEDAVNVKGKSLEGMTELANGRAVSVQAICLMHHR